MTTHTCHITRRLRLELKAIISYQIRKVADTPNAAQQPEFSKWNNAAANRISGANPLYRVQGRPGTQKEVMQPIEGANWAKMRNTTLGPGNEPKGEMNERTDHKLQTYFDGGGIRQTSKTGVPDPPQKRRRLSNCTFY